MQQFLSWRWPLQLYPVLWPFHPLNQNISQYWARYEALKSLFLMRLCWSQSRQGLSCSCQSGLRKCWWWWLTQKIIGVSSFGVDYPRLDKRTQTLGMCTSSCKWLQVWSNGRMFQTGQLREETTLTSHTAPHLGRRNIRIRNCSPHRKFLEEYPRIPCCPSLFTKLILSILLIRSFFLFPEKSFNEYFSTCNGRKSSQAAFGRATNVDS